MRVYVTATVFHSRVVYGFSNKDYGYCASARRPLDGTFKNNKTGSSDGLVGELLKYGGSGMIDLLQQLFAVV